MDSIHEYLKDGGNRKKKRMTKSKHFDSDPERGRRQRRKFKNYRDVDKYGFDYDDDLLLDDEEDEESDQ
jgi:hypothetical protein